MTSIQRGGVGGQKNTILLTNSIDFKDKERGEGLKNPKILWTSYVCRPLPPSPCTERMWISAKWMERSISPQSRHLYVRILDFFPGVGRDSRLDDLKRSVLWFWGVIKRCREISRL